MSRFHGPQPGHKSENGSFRRNGPKGAKKLMQSIKREEAEERQAEYRKKQQQEKSSDEQSVGEDLRLVQD
jgi:hypothetical protein